MGQAAQKARNAEHRRLHEKTRQAKEKKAAKSQARLAKKQSDAAVSVDVQYCASSMEGSCHLFSGSRSKRKGTKPPVSIPLGDVASFVLVPYKYVSTGIKVICIHSLIGQALEAQHIFLISQDTNVPFGHSVIS
jgi:hypothetical protein